MSQQPPELPKEGDEPIEGDGAHHQKRKPKRSLSRVARVRLIQCDSPPLSDSGGGINYAAIAGTYSASNWLGDL